MSNYEEQINQIIHQSPIVVLIKGTAGRPYCKFTRQMIHLLVSNGIHFTFYDVRQADKEFYEFIKKHVNFPTFPQVCLF